MAAFTFKSPEGSSYTVNGPDGATPEQAFQVLQQRMGAQDAVDKVPSGIASNFAYGGLKGMADVGRTVMNVGAKLLPQEAQDWLHQKQAEGDAQLAQRADTQGIPFAAGRVAGNVLATAGPTRAVGAIVSAIPKAAALGEAIGSGGLGAQTGGLGTRVAGGAIAGGTQAGLIDPDSADTGAAIGGVLPLAGRVVNAVGKVAGSIPSASKAGTILVDSLQNPPQEVVQRLRNAPSPLPGATTNAAEASGDLGLSRLRNAVLTKNPQEATNALAEDFAKNGARTEALQSISGHPNDLIAAKEVRANITGPLYEKAYSDTVPATPQMMALLSRPSQAGIGQARNLAAEEGADITDNTIGMLHYAKKALDDKIANAAQTGLGPAQKRALVGTQKALLQAMDDASPAYAEARSKFQELSKPINQMEALQDVVRRVKTGSFDDDGNAILSGPTLNNILKNEGADLSKTLSPEQMSTLRRVQSDLNASSLVKRSGAAQIGSNTAANQNAVNQLTRLGGGGTNGVPLIGNTLQWVGERRANAVIERLAEALRNPEVAANLIEKSAPRASSQNQALATLLRRLPAVAVPHESQQ